MASDDFRINGSELIKYSGRDSVVEIPQGVEVIGEGAFKGNMYLEEVIIPDSVTCIMREAFKNCKKLKKVKLPKYLACVQEWAFEYSPWIDACEPFDVLIPEGIEKITWRDFEGISHYTRYNAVMREMVNIGIYDRHFHVKGPIIDRLILSGSVKEIEHHAFSGVQIKQIQFNDGLEKIGDRAFWGNGEIKDIVLPDSVTELHKDAFISCCDELIVRCGEGAFSSMDRAIRDRTCVKWLKGELKCTPSQEKAMTKYVGRTRNAFFKLIKGDDAGMLANILACGKAKLEQIEAYIEKASDGKHPQMLAVLLDYQHKFFSQEKITLAADQKSGFAERTAKEWEKIFRLKKDETGYILVKYKGIDKKPEIPTEIEGTPVYAIGNNCFKGKDSIEEIDIPGSIQTIGDSAFEGCLGLKTVHFNKGLLHVGKRAFYGCKNLEGEMFLPEGLLTNGNNAFNFGETAKFEALHVPESMKEFKGWYGWECSSDLYIHGKKTKYNSEMVTVMRALYVHRDSRDGKWLLEKLASGETPQWPFKIIGMDDEK